MRFFFVLAACAVLAVAASAQVAECGYSPGMESAARANIRGARSLLTQARAAYLAGDAAAARQDGLMAESLIEDVCSRSGSRRVWKSLVAAASAAQGSTPESGGWEITGSVDPLTGAKVTDFLLSAQRGDGAFLGFVCPSGKIQKSNPATWTFLTGRGQMIGPPAGHSTLIGWGFRTNLAYGGGNPYQFVQVRLEDGRRSRLVAQQWYIAPDDRQFFIGKSYFKALLRATTVVVGYTSLTGDLVTEEFHTAGLNNAKVRASCGAAPAKW